MLAGYYRRTSDARCTHSLGLFDRLWSGSDGLTETVLRNIVAPDTSSWTCTPVVPYPDVRARSRRGMHGSPA